MPVYPVMFNLAGRLCVVVGGGSVALRKVRGLLAAGARVRIVAPRIDGELCEDPAIERRVRPFLPCDLDGAWLVFAATATTEVNQVVADAANVRGLPCNRADLDGGGDFAVPAILRRGRMTVAVASEGGSPALSALLRDRIAGSCGDEWGVVAEIAGALRRKELTGCEVSEYNREVMLKLVAGGLPELVAGGQVDAIDRLLQTTVGAAATLKTLGVTLPKGTR